MAASSSLLASNLISSNPKFLTLTLPSFSKPLTNLSSFLPAPFAAVKLRRGRGLELGFVRRVASVSSEYDQDEAEEEEVGSGDEEPSFSPDLKLFVGNLPFSVDSAQLAELFDDAGTVEMVEVIYDKITRKSRGFGFVTMSTVEEVREAVQKFNGYEFKGRTLRVNSGPPPPREERPSFRSGGGGGSFDAANRLYVGNLSWSIDGAALETVFSEQGKVMDAKVVYDRESGRSRGFGFVTYSTAEEAKDAISTLHGSDLDGRTIQVTVAEAKPPRREF